MHYVIKVIQWDLIGWLAFKVMLTRIGLGTLTEEDPPVDMYLLRMVVLLVG